MQTTQSIGTPQHTVIPTVTPCKDWTMISPPVAADDRLARENAEVRVFSEMAMQTTQSMGTPQPT